MSVGWKMWILLPMALTIAIQVKRIEKKVTPTSAGSSKIPKTRIKYKNSAVIADITNRINENPYTFH
ncbi:MAG: hypothetical protein RBG13Loki_0744 [Promethearchaeota archaeon CR_4]|nr:MAG: hypothetical protein RBG13Loki_0744 [Candidatus Lokiarchaeota archaeon CR_4]